MVPAQCSSCRSRALAAAPSSARSCCSLRGRVGAHELERTQVVAHLSADGSFVLDIANDPNWLLLRLESFAGGQVPPGITPAARDGDSASSSAVFIDRVVLFVDGHEIRPLVGRVPSAAGRARVDALPPLATFRLRGRMPSQRADAALAVRARHRSLSADDPPRRRRRAHRVDPRIELERHRRSDRSVPPGDASRRDARLPRARLHAHPAEGSRSHPLRAWVVSPQRALAADPDPGHDLHDRPLDHARSR